MHTDGFVRITLAAALVAGCGSDPGPGEEMAGFTSIATGTARSCVVDVDGAASCWGELGLAGATTVASTPVAVDATLRFAQLSAFGNVVCGVAPDDIARCWGPNDHGQLGQGTIGPGSATPVIVGTSRPFASVTAGDATPCGITPASEPLCWGSNALGQVGADAGPSDIQSPLPLAGALRMRELSTSKDFVCGISTAGEAYCWGSNAGGQLGNGGAISGQASDISRVPSKVVGGHTWSTITTGDQFACGLTSAGAAYCWGRNEYRLGTKDGAAFCWGANTHGQLGAGATAASQPSTSPVAVAGGLTFAELRASDGDHVCAITADRQAVYCWGRNHVGQLGTGAVSTDRTPAPVLVKL